MGAHQWTKQDEVHVTICASDGDTTVCCPVVIQPMQHVENSTFRWIMDRDWKVTRREHVKPTGSNEQPYGFEGE